MKSSTLHIALLPVWLILASLSTSTLDSVLALLAVWATLSARQALQAVAISIVLKYVNPGLVQVSSYTGVLLWLITVVAFVRVLLAMRASTLRRVAPFWIFSGIAAVLSLGSSLLLVISLMKLLSFTMIVSTIILGVDSLTQKERLQTSDWLQGFAVTIVALSLLTLLRPEAAYLRTGHSFQGIFNHPQALGVILAPFVSSAAIAALLFRGRRQWVYILFTLVAGAMMFGTQARTAALASAAAMLFALFVYYFGRTRFALKRSGLAVALLLCAALLAGGIAAMSLPAVQNALAGFLFKRGGESVEDAFYESRGAGIAGQWNNFLERPLSGHGFGVYAHSTSTEGVVEFAGIPISAPTEKGFVPTAILEETGVLGFAAFLYALWVFSAPLRRQPDPRWVAMFVAGLLVNIGEAVLLAPAGTGGLIWLMLALASAMPGAMASAAQKSSPATEIPDAATAT